MSKDHASSRTDSRTAAANDNRAAWTIKDFCEAAGIGRTRFYEELKLGRIKAKKCGSKTLAVTNPAVWVASLPDFGEVA